jgi:hypothetical protein
MKRLSLPYLCAISALVLVVGSVAAQFGGGSEPTNNSAKKSDKPAAEKASTAATSNQAKPEILGSDFCQCTEGKPEAMVRIEKALATPLNSTGLDYSDTPLKEVADQLSTDYNIPVQLDPVALEEAGIATDVPVTISVHNISLRSALDLLSKRINVTYVVQDEVLLFTTHEMAERNLQVCVYDVRNITENGNDKLVDSLKETVQCCIQPDSWAVNGGRQAQVRAVKPGLLVISQTQDVHQKIHDLIGTIQKMSKK